jgi:hypothetical protein
VLAGPGIFLRLPARSPPRGDPDRMRNRGGLSRRLGAVDDRLDPSSAHYDAGISVSGWLSAAAETEHTGPQGLNPAAFVTGWSRSPSTGNLPHEGAPYGIGNTKLLVSSCSAGLRAHREAAHGSSAPVGTARRARGRAPTTRVARGADSQSSGF